MLREQIKSINFEFLQEAKSSPKLLADMASMESYLAENYGERIVMELLQNADDALSRKVLLKVEKNTVYFANDGNPFSESDLLAICRSGSSDKQRGTDIGYRGVGFKSTTSVSKNILIFSSDTFFSFSKAHCARELHCAEKNVPAIRVPFLVEPKDISKNILKDIYGIVDSGYTTVFTFLDCDLDGLLQEIDSFDVSSLLFLRNVRSFDIENNRDQKNYSVKRTEYGNDCSVELAHDNFVSRWIIPDGKNTQNFAFKTDKTGQIIPCDDSEAVFHCFLPTLEPGPFRMKINGDFSTEPSRKHLTLDLRTKETLSHIAENLQKLVANNLAGKRSYPGLLDVVDSRFSFGIAASFFYKIFTEKNETETKIALTDGAETSLRNYSVLSSDFSEEEKGFLRSESEPIKKVSPVVADPNVMNYLERKGSNKFEDDTYLKSLESMDFVRKCDPKLYAKMLNLGIQNLKWKNFGKTGAKPADIIYICGADYEAANLLTASDSFYAAPEVEEALTQTVSESDWKWFAKFMGIQYDLFHKNKDVTDLSEAGADDGQTDSENSINHIMMVQLSKWKDAESQCVDIEKLFGNNAKGVGAKNLGYDVESVTPSGAKRYIEVKSVSADKGYFTLTNNEYSTAHLLGNEYYLCILLQQEKGIKATYIQNPLENLNFEKRVKVWEWFCEEYSGENHTFSFKES